MKERTDKIKLLILDVDGVLTDGRIYFSDSGEEIKAFHIRDGTGIRLAQQAGIGVAFISSRYSQTVARRAEELNIEDIYQKVINKVEIYGELKRKYGLADNQICYVGDDIQDIDVIELAGMGCAVADAEEVVKKAADLVTKRPGGRGAVREIVNMILGEEQIASSRWTAPAVDFPTKKKDRK